MKKAFKIILLAALPASGKSEIRNLLKNIDKDTLLEEYHIGENLQLDDFPYVFFMRRIDSELIELGLDPIYYNNEGPFKDPRDWKTLINLLNEDYFDLINKREIGPKNISYWMFERLENASRKSGIDERLSKLSSSVLERIAKKLEIEASNILKDKISEYPKNDNESTIIIEMSRGAKEGSNMPLDDPFGYEHSFKEFDDEILKNASVLYIYVTPEESRRKNIERSKPNEEGSILNHSVPEIVMINDYGCDDILYLVNSSSIENTITINKNNESYYLPTGIFDNRIDKTSFLRDNPNTWNELKRTEVSKDIKEILNNMWDVYKK